MILRHPLIPGLGLVLTSLAALASPASAAPQTPPTRDVVPAHFILRTEELKSTFALTGERLALREKIANRLIPPALDALTTLALTPADRRTTTVTEPISGAVWGTGLVNYQGRDFRAAIVNAMAHFGDASGRTQRDLLEAIHTLYLPLAADDPLAEPLRSQVLRPGVNPRFAAMAAIILRSDPVTAQASGVDTPEHLAATLSRALGTDASASTSPHIQSVLRAASAPVLPPWPETSQTLLTVLRHPSPSPGMALLISIQGTNRDYPGFTVARRRDGRFVRDADGRIVMIRHLARSQTNLPGTFSNGNTPSGYMSIAGLALTTGNVFIGPSPMILSEVPFEADPARFFHSAERPETSAPATVIPDQWTQDLYTALLPPVPALRDQLMEAWTAGQAGRGEILLHGNVTEPGLHARPGPQTRQAILKSSGNPWSPFGPSMGCATPIELWDEKTGQCLQSDQIRLVTALLAADANRNLPPPGDAWPQAGVVPQPLGFLLTLDLIPPRPEGFLEADIEPVIKAAEPTP